MRKGSQAKARMIARYVVEVSSSGKRQFAKYETVSRTDELNELVFYVSALPIGAAIYLFIPGGSSGANSAAVPSLQAGSSAIR
jgi:hypothetical protein